MARCAVIDKETMVVSNVIIWTGDKWNPPLGHIVVKSDTADIGDIYDPKSHTFKRQENESTD